MSEAEVRELLTKAAEALVARAARIRELAIKHNWKAMHDLAAVRVEYWKEAADVLKSPDFQAELLKPLPISTANPLIPCLLSLAAPKPQR